MDDNKFESQMTLYSVDTSNGSVYFETKEQLENYTKNNQILGKTKIEFMGNILNSIDVIRQTFEDGTCRYISVANEDGYMYYDYEQSKEEHIPVWGYLQGSLRDIYEVFKIHGIKLEDDTYQRIDNQYHQKVKQHLKRQLA